MSNNFYADLSALTNIDRNFQKQMKQMDISLQKVNEARWKKEAEKEQREKDLLDYTRSIATNIESMKINSDIQLSNSNDLLNAMLQNNQISKEQLATVNLLYDLLENKNDPVSLKEQIKANVLSLAVSHGVQTSFALLLKGLELL